MLEHEVGSDDRVPARRSASSRATLAAALLLYVAALAAVTLLPEGQGTSPRGNVVPFASLLATWTDSDAPVATRATYLMGNLLLLSPLALLARLSGSRFGAGRFALGGAALSAGIELAQWLWIDGRAGDIDDALLNTAGAVAVWMALGPLARWSSERHATT